jgi:hypothetical protein
METSIHRSADSKEITTLNKFSQYTKIFEFYEKSLLPMVRNFIKDRLDCSKILKNDKDHHEILSLFEKNVISKANEAILISNSINIK